MKLTTQQLRQIIREEASHALNPKARAAEKHLANFKSLHAEFKRMMAEVEHVDEDFGDMFDDRRLHRTRELFETASGMCSEGLQDMIDACEEAVRCQTGVDLGEYEARRRGLR